MQIAPEPALQVLRTTIIRETQETKNDFGHLQLQASVRCKHTLGSTDSIDSAAHLTIHAYTIAVAAQATLRPERRQPQNQYRRKPTAKTSFWD